MDINKLNNEDLEKIKIFSLEGLKTKARFCQIYDGDTCKAVFLYNNEIKRWNCRINGIDTPELRTKNIKEKELGITARDYLKTLLNNKTLDITCGSFDKYGRLLIDIYDEDGISISNKLIEKGYANKYNGGTKKKWDL